MMGRMQEETPRYPLQEVLAVLKVKRDFNELNDIQTVGMLFKLNTQKLMVCRRYKQFA